MQNYIYIYIYTYISIYIYKCREEELDRRPSDFQSDALPLSYPGMSDKLKKLSKLPIKNKKIYYKY